MGSSAHNLSKGLENSVIELDQKNTDRLKACTPLGDRIKANSC